MMHFIWGHILIVMLFVALIAPENLSEDPLFWLELRRKGTCILQMINVAIMWGKVGENLLPITITIIARNAIMVVIERKFER